MATPTTNYNLLKPATGETYDVALLDTNYDKIDAQMFVEATAIKTALKAIGVSSTGIAWGSYPPLTSDFKVVIGSNVASTDASGYSGIDMPVSFSNGYFVIGLANGDVAAQPNVTFGMSTGIFTNLASRFYIRVMTANTGAALPSSSARVNYIAIGW